MRIVHVDESFHPSYGYHANPLAKFQRKMGHEVIVVTAEKKWIHPVYKEFGDDGTGLEEADKQYEEATGVRIVRVPALGRIMCRLVYGREIFRIVDSLKPDVVYVHCIETLTAMRFIFRKQKYPMLFDTHMLSMATKNPLAKQYEVVYKALFTKIIKKKKYDVIRTQDDDYVNTHLGVPEDQTPFISFGTDTILFAPSEEVRQSFREELGIGQDTFLVVYTGKLTESKGGKILAEAFLKKFPVPVALLCVGTPPEDEYGKEVNCLLHASENKIIMFPTQKYTELAKFYQVGDLSVFPRQCSMSFYDAQSCGLPVLSEDNNVNVDRCSHENGMNFASGDAEDFREKILHLAQMDKQQYQQMRCNARAFIENGYDYKQIAQEYTDYLHKAVQRFEQEKAVKG